LSSKESVPKLRPVPPEVRAADRAAHKRFYRKAAVILGVMVASTFLIYGCQALAITAAEIRVIDGDTIEAQVAGGRFSAAARRLVTYRLVGFDTPETAFAACDEERVHGERAKARLAELLSSGPIRIEAGAGRPDRYGRGLARLYVADEDVGDVLVREGLAVPYSGRGRRINWCKRFGS
jgi:micrococcal nuclease